MLGYLKRLADARAPPTRPPTSSRSVARARHAAALHAAPHARRDYGYAEIAAHAVILALDPRCASGSARRSCASGSSTTTPSTRRRLARTATGCGRLASRTVVALIGAGLRRAAVEAAARPPRRDARCGFGAARPVGVHEPRDRLRAAARRGARRAYLVASLGQRRCSPSRSRCRSSSSRDEGARGLRAGQLRRLGGRAARRCGSTLRRHVGVRAAPRARSARCCASALPTVPADAAVFALNVVDRAYLLHAPSPRAPPASTRWRSSSRRW